MMGPKTNPKWAHVGRGNSPRRYRTGRVYRPFGHTCNSESDGSSLVADAHDPGRQPAKRPRNAT